MKSCFTLMLAAAAAVVAAPALASGGGMPYDRFVNRDQPDLAPARYQAGQLGVVQPHFQRVYLYAAWRAIALGTGGLKAAPNPPGAILRATGAAYSGWDDYDQSKTVYQGWKEAAATALKQAPRAAPDTYSYRDCPREGYIFATQTLRQLAQRADATPARLQAWIDAQNTVFAFCGDDPRQSTRPFVALPPLPVPADLPASDGAWAQLRGYQVAAAYFYKGDYADSTARFAAIGATPNHPMRAWGAYLALRSSTRAAAATMKFNSPDMTERADALAAQAQRILADAALAPLHEATRAAVRAMQARITPQARFEQISTALDQPRNDPYQRDYLGDWRVLANERINMFRPESWAAPAQRHEFIDWILTLNACDFPPNEGCAKQRAHALEKWDALAASDTSAARTWLVAAIMLADTLPASLELAALRVKPDAPEYATVRYHLARNYRTAGQADKARAIDDAMLALPADSIAMRNLFLQERFAVATSNADAARFLMRKPLRTMDADTGETAPAREQATPASDGRRWINAGLTVADLLQLARDSALDQPVRDAIAAMTWLRADLLGQHDVALRAAALLEPDPAFREATRAYRSAKSADERRHIVLLAALRLRITTALDDYEPHLTAPFAAAAPVDTAASNWCRAPVAERFGDAGSDPEKPPPAPATATDAAQRAREQALLDALPTATGFIGRHVLQHAAAQPNDPELPWLLYVVVQSTRGGCLDADAHNLSKQAFTLLHKRFPDNEWARKTPYFY
ncbi:MAG: hypothetical protein QFF03_05790 [Pseudomonadota bacterium]|nr:hypothetical protein [Pseudomonadota bacterium]